MPAPAYGFALRVAPLVRRVVASNPSPFTLWGTNSFLVGTDEVAIIDPGPDIPGHVEVLLDAVRGQNVIAILCTHNHRDHSPASRPLAVACGAPIIGCAALVPAEDAAGDEAFDAEYRPDRVLADGERLDGHGWSLEAIATPGHTSNHLCFALAGTRLLFSGDHVMGWATSVVSPPDGDMADYLSSLDKLSARDDTLFLPAHGDAITDPVSRLRELIVHRRAREQQILTKLESGPNTIPSIVGSLYADVDIRLHAAAGQSVLAHLIDLERRGLAERDGDGWRLSP